MELVGLNIIECSKPKGIKLKMRAHKLKSMTQWQGALKQKGIKQGLHVFLNSKRKLWD